MMAYQLLRQTKTTYMMKRLMEVYSLKRWMTKTEALTMEVDRTIMFKTLDVLILKSAPLKVVHQGKTGDRSVIPHRSIDAPLQNNGENLHAMK
jgi:hypothetical protein